MNNILFEDYLNEPLKDPEFKKEFDTESTKLESAVSLTKIRKSEGYLKENCHLCRIFHNLQLPELKVVLTRVLIL